MLYVPKEWIKHEENTNKVFELLDNTHNPEEIEKTLLDIDEPYLLEHFKHGEINTDM